MAKKKTVEERVANRLTPEAIADIPADRVRSFGMGYWCPRGLRRRAYGRSQDTRRLQHIGKKVATHAMNLRGRGTPFWTEARLKRYAEEGAKAYWDNRWSSLNDTVAE